MSIRRRGIGLPFPPIPKSKRRRTARLFGWPAVVFSLTSDFTSYAKNFPKGMHLAEAEIIARKLARSASTGIKDSPAAAAPAAPAGFKPGVYHGFFTGQFQMTPGP